MLLLDTCAVIWLADGSLDTSPIRPQAEAAARANGLYVSVTSAWELGLLVRAGRMTLLPDTKTWFQNLINRPGLRLAPITPAIAIDASQLPGTLHGDPADRLIIATARHLPATIVTRDRRIIEYAASGHAEALVC